MTAFANNPSPSSDEGTEPTRRLLRLPEGGLAIGDAVGDPRSTMTQQFRVRRSEVRRQVEADERRKPKLPSKASDASFPTVVAALVCSPLAVDAYSAGMPALALTIAIAPAALAAVASVLVSARLDTL